MCYQYRTVGKQKNVKKKMKIIPNTSSENYCKFFGECFSNLSLSLFIPMYVNTHI